MWAGEGGVLGSGQWDWQWEGGDLQIMNSRKVAFPIGNTNSVNSHFLESAILIRRADPKKNIENVSDRLANIQNHIPKQNTNGAPMATAKPYFCALGHISPG